MCVCGIVLLDFLLFLFFLLAGKCRVMAAARNQRCRFNATPPFQKRNSKPIAESAVPEKKQKKNSQSGNSVEPEKEKDQKQKNTQPTRKRDVARRFFFRFVDSFFFDIFFSTTAPLPKPSAKNTKKKKRSVSFFWVSNRSLLLLLLLLLLRSSLRRRRRQADRPVGRRGVGCPTSPERPISSSSSSFSSSSSSSSSSWATERIPVRHQGRRKPHFASLSN